MLERAWMLRKPYLSSSLKFIHVCTKAVLEQMNHTIPRSYTANGEEAKDPGSLVPVQPFSKKGSDGRLAAENKVGNVRNCFLLREAKMRA